MNFAIDEEFDFTIRSEVGKASDNFSKGACVGYDGKEIEVSETCHSYIRIMILSREIQV